MHKSKFQLKLRRPHPHGKMHLQKHVITNVFAEYSLTPDEVKELYTEGGKYWFTVLELDNAPKKSTKE